MGMKVEGTARGRVVIVLYASRAGPPPPGLHLDVVKNGSVLQKLLIDEKPCYVFGRVKELCDFPLQHQSCSRQHAALVYHKHLKRPFLIDLGSSEFLWQVHTFTVYDSMPIWMRPVYTYVHVHVQDLSSIVANRKANTYMIMSMIL